MAPLLHLLLLFFSTFSSETYPGLVACMVSSIVIIGSSVVSCDSYPVGCVVSTTPSKWPTNIFQVIIIT